jgi:hypothetical protein
MTRAAPACMHAGPLMWGVAGGREGATHGRAGQGRGCIMRCILGSEAGVPGEGARLKPLAGFREVQSSGATNHAAQRLMQYNTRGSSGSSGRSEQH